jgi:aspartyl-tRNA(Asn)/glutamyl-tRNA(Gln) amidotransferase subunit A
VTGPDRLGAFVHYAPQPGGAGPLGGMPVAVKDNIDVRGMPTAAGMEPYRGRVAPRDAPCVERLRNAGATIVGKTLMDEAAFGAVGDNPWFGRCHNPHRHGHTCGGSSAGSAAAVAAGLCEAALGTDTLGSVRIPASYCGVVAYLPSRGLVDNAGVMPLMPEFDRVGVLAGSVARAARIASVMAGRDLRPRAGGTVGRQPPGNLAAVRRAALLLVEVEAARIHAALLDDPDSNISPPLRAALRFGRDASSERIAKAKACIAEAKRWLDEQFRHCDVLVLPTTPGPAFPFDQPAPESQADYTVLANIAGLAGISVPGNTVDGLPVGMQVIGRNDALVLGVALTLMEDSQSPA